MPLGLLVPDVVEAERLRDSHGCAVRGDKCGSGRHTSRAARLVMTSQKNHRPRAGQLVRLRFLPRNWNKHKPARAVSLHVHTRVCASSVRD